MAHEGVFLMMEDKPPKSIVILSARSLFADGVASQLQQAAHDLELRVLDPNLPEAIERIVDAQPSVIIMDGGDSELSRLCPLRDLVSVLPTVRIIWLKPQQDVVQLVTSEQRIATQVSNLIEMINQP
jgi:DNA-binding NarL/FixJ family response regulator